MYDPFKYADNFESEEEYLKELEEENDKKRSGNSRTDTADIERQ